LEDIVANGWMYCTITKTNVGEVGRIETIIPQ